MSKLELLENFIETTHKVYEEQRSSLYKGFTKLIYDNLGSFGIPEMLASYTWVDFIDKMEEGSYGEASYEDCKKEVLNHFYEYLSEKDRKYFDASVVLDFSREYIKNNLI